MSLVRNALVALCLVTAVAGAQHFVLDIPGTFVDLSASATSNLVATSDDSTHSFISTVGNAMFPAGNLRLGNNGALVNTGAVLTAGGVGLTNAAIASGTNAVPAGLGTTANIVAALCPFWDDLDTLTAGGTEVRWEEIGGNLYVMWKNEGHWADVAGQSITFEIIVFGGAGGPCTPYAQMIFPDVAFGGTQAAFDFGLSATVGYVAAAALGGGFLNAQWSFNQNALSDGMVLSLVEGPGVPFGTVITSPGGAGTAQVDWNGTQFCFGGTYFMAINFVDESPKWFFGLGISFPAVISQFNSGFPYLGLLGTTTGPLAAPSGLTVYYATIAWPSAATPAPHLVQSGTSYTIP
jgi:hypothetical protein